MILIPKKITILGKKILIGSILAILFITIEEFHQQSLATRTFDLVDLLCSYIGIFFGDRLAKYSRKKIGLEKVEED